MTSVLDKWIEKWRPAARRATGALEEVPAMSVTDEYLRNNAVYAELAPGYARAPGRRCVSSRAGTRRS